MGCCIGMQREEKRTKLVSRIQVLTSLTSETEREKRKRENFGLAHKMGWREGRREGVLRMGERSLEERNRTDAGV